MNKRLDNRGAARIRQLFPDHGDQIKVTRATGVKQGVVSRWFSGRRKPDPKQRAKLEDLYGIGWRLWDEDLSVSSRDRTLRTASS